MSLADSRAARSPLAPHPAPPAYLQQTYHWAYVTPEAVRRFERQWLVNLILWGNFARLRDEALDTFGDDLAGPGLQIACVYGDLTARWAMRYKDAGELEVIDVLPVQIDNLRRKLGADSPVRSRLADATALPHATASQDRALLFFLLHEMPFDVRLATVREAFRVVRPGGRIVFVDYHRPAALHPLRWPMELILRTLEPFALGLWRGEIADLFPADMPPAKVTKRTSFGGLYQLIEVTR